MTGRIAQIAIVAASFMLCASAAAGVCPPHMRHARRAYVHGWHAARAPQTYGAAKYQGRSVFGPALPLPPGAYSPEYGVKPYGYAMGRPCMSLDDCDRKDFDESGTRGRMGLGADPAHPEGPGNVSD